MSDTYCPVPWRQLAISPSGTVRLCCVASPDISISEKESNGVYRLDSNLSHALNSKMFRSVRGEMKAGRWPVQCSQCKLSEEGGAQSERLVWRNKFPHFNPDSLEEFVDPSEIEILDLRLGNQCNLRCRMCSPYSSSSWEKEWQYIDDIVEVIPEEKKIRLKSGWENKNTVWDQLIQVIPSLREVLLTGGEPLLTPGAKKFVQYCVEMNASKNIHLRYATNLTVWDDELVSLWKNFRKVSIRGSVDGIGPINDYIRFPSKWNKILGAIEKYEILSRENQNISFGIHCAVQIYNIFSLQEIIHFFKKRNTDIYFSLVANPGILSLNVLSEDLASILEKKLSVERKNHAQISMVLLALDSSQKSKWSTFLDYTDRLDKIRKQRLSDYVPQLFTGSQ